MKKHGICVLLCLGIFNGVALQAQDFVIKRIELLNQQVVIHYDLRDSVKGRTYSISAYASTDNFINPLVEVTGEIGPEVKPGNNKKIIWNAREELGEKFVGGASLEIRGKLYIPFITFTGIDEYKTLKRLKPYEVTWSGGTPQNILNFELYKDDTKIATFPNIANVGHYRLVLPKDIRPGNNYRLRASDSKNKDEVVYTGTFSVKRKTALVTKVLPIAAVGYLIMTMAGGEEGGPSEIEDPIKP